MKLGPIGFFNIFHDFMIEAGLQSDAASTIACNNATLPAYVLSSSTAAVIFAWTWTDLQSKKKYETSNAKVMTGVHLAWKGTVSCEAVGYFQANFLLFEIGWRM